MFSQTVEYALRAVVYLAQHEADGVVGNRTIAEATQVPPSYLSKVLHALGCGGNFGFASGRGRRLPTASVAG